MRLPECSARYLDDEAPQIICRHPQVHAVGSVVTAEFCRTCALRLAPCAAELRSLEEVQRLQQRLKPCLFLGMQTGERECPTCNGRVRIKVFACRHEAHGETTWRECQTCPDHQPESRSAVCSP